MSQLQKITPFLWFDNQAEEAANFYVSVFSNSRTGETMRNDGAVLVQDFWLDGQKFSALNGGPHFRLNPSISFYVVCETEAETDEVWNKLSEGGTVLMPLDRYHWSEKYGWIQDRFGASWQIGWGKMEEVGQKFSPLLMFSGPQQGRAEEALNFYTGLFKDSSIVGIMRYGAGEQGPEGQITHAQFKLNGQTFMLMDSGVPQPFTFNEALSLSLSCENQQEVDFFWNKLIADGGEESQCGWLKDKFGVSWQIVPVALPRLLKDPDPAVAQRVMAAMMKMRKIDIATLEAAAGKTNPPITIETTVNAPVETVWERWTGPEHITKWNNASEDWHTPKAQNDLRKGGSFTFTMAARDGSMSFDFGGVYDEVVENQRIAYSLEDGRKVDVTFEARDGGTHITETFDPENENPLEMQRGGWQAILDNFKKYTEASNN